MAAAIPVKDVLCEAMDYLSKLGSNLRTRSENLKEKKIRRDKLTNTLAVSKAADKVLLICELSKKSLVNVEASVRKILEHIDVSRAPSSVGGKSSISKTDNKKRDDKYYYFDYRSRKLKIKHNISIKHYRSVKVLAKKMPFSMISKYPVYHDCKLYRLRKKENRPQEKDSLEIQNLKNDENPETKRRYSESSSKSSEFGIPKSPAKRKSALITDSEDNSNDNMNLKNDIEQSSRTDNTIEKDNNLEISKSTERKRKNKKYDKTNSISKQKSTTINSSDDDNSINSSNEKNDTKHLSVNINDEKANKLSEEPACKKRKITISESEDQCNDVVQSDVESDIDYNNPCDNIGVNDASKNETSSENGSAKPLIKCVSLSKLLKPDVLQNNSTKSTQSVHKTTKTDVAKKNNFNVAKKNEMLLKTKKNKDSFWAKKREEVKAFKPKELFINIYRLPDLNTYFLLKNHLRRVTRAGDIVCEISTDSDDDNVIKSSKEKHRKKSIQCEGSASSNDVEKQHTSKVNKAKNSLVESDSDNDIESNTYSNKVNETTVDKIKKSLLHSDSDGNEDTDVASESNKKRTEKSNENCSDKNHNSDTESRPKENEENLGSKAISDTEADKNDLLKKSDSDSKSEESASINDFMQQNSPVINDSQITHREQKTPEKDDAGNKDDSAKKSLLNDSSDDGKSEKSDGKKDSIQQSDSVNDDSENSDIEQKTPENDATGYKDDNAKKLLLNDSSDELNEIPLNQRKTTPHSKKKRIRESVQAKNALLRYSSGSETEDEQLRNVLTDIKNSLLEGISDDETLLNVKALKEGKSSSPEELLGKDTKKQSVYDSDSIISNRSDRSQEKRNRKVKNKRKNMINSDDDTSEPSSRKMVRSKAKPGNSTSHSSEVQDHNDKDIEGLANLSTLNKPRRRNSDTSDVTESSDSTATKSRTTTKPNSMISEEILQAESSSDEEKSNDGNDAVEEDLPPVTMTGFNGGLEHLVKEDLLGESDSSVSDKEENKGDSDEEEEKLNAKRRKANAIASSDSETSTRKKEKDESVKLSDFDSDDSEVTKRPKRSDSDESEVTKRTKRKKKGSDSDASVGSSDDAGKKKRRRIKSVNDSDASGSDSENEGKNKHGRKNIRRVMGKNQLEEATKKAAREEKERVARIAERQKMYNNVQFDESGRPDEVVLDKVVLDFDPDTKEPLIEVDRGLVKKLKPHQANGIKFMWDACFESVKRIKKDKGSGCILAHCMGLGKTLQVVSLTHTLLSHGSLTKVERVLVVCPLSTVLNWVNEYKMWLKFAERDSDVDVYELSRYKQNSERAFQLSQWFAHGGVCVLGYEMFRNLSADNNKKFKKKMLKNFQEALVDPGPDLVVCDEGHLLKNEKTSLSQSMNKVKTLRRIVLTGTPLQNNLKEYYCMVQFVKPNLLGKYNEYLNRFVNPITNGQYTDSTDHDIKIMKRRSHVLHKMLDGAVQRRDYGVLAPFLPPKNEYVLFLTLSAVQVKLYQHYLDNYSRRPLPGKSSGFLFPDFQSLQRIWTHPLVLKYNSERYEILQQKKRDKEDEDSEGSLVDFIDDDSTPDESSADESSDDSSDMSDDSRKKSKKKKSSKKSKGKDRDKESAAASKRRTRANPVEQDEEDDDKNNDIMEVKYENPTEWWIKMVTEDELDDMRHSHKLVLLFDILRQCETIGDKLLVFSQSLYSLDLIEHFLGKVDEATQEGRIDEKLCGHVGSWSPGIDYFRLDGSTSCENRSIWCKNFNREDNPRARLFLISTRAGGLGINLVAANRVVIFDVSWNPSHDVQSIFRVYRFGQKKPCYVYRFLAMGTMEEKIYERQVTKQAISKRVIDEQQIDRHYAENDLAELYKFEAEPPLPRELPPLPKDRLFAEMLREHEKQIYKYHEHDSLLENKEEETLSEEERKAAWEDFENEKTRPPPAPFVSPWNMHNGMVPNLLAQQQQFAFAALAAMMRKEGANDAQIRDAVPMLYNSNPGVFGGYDYGLMQKMSELYKYSQMNMAPAMMGQAGMNTGHGGGAALGGSSGLQYEPPWQRQQQQQQQMRLQQLLAQQQNMGAAAKFYAGGLGSRDPVAMALQQQRAREIMVGGGAGRPRGRPPLQPRAPPAPSADVVNLDSD